MAPGDRLAARRVERGSIVPLVAVVLVAALLCLWVVAGVAERAAIRAAAQSAADAAALAGAVEGRASAVRLAEANDGRLVEFESTTSSGSRAGSLVVRVRVVVERSGWRAQAWAERRLE